MRNLINLISENGQVQPAQNIPLSQKIYSFFQNANQLPAEMIGPVEELAATIVSILSVSKQIQAELQIHEASYSGATPNIEFIQRAGKEYLKTGLEVIRSSLPNEGQVEISKLHEIMDMLMSPENMIKIQKSPNVQKATTAAIKGIQLNTRGMIGKLDADIEQVAQNFAKKFNTKPIWARNLVGMFGIAVPHKDRVKFLQACDRGEALDIKQMIKNGQGSIDSIVTTKIPGIKDVFKSVKETLLDISLSTGQRGATGPFEAVLAIMGGARKPSGEEGGDLIFDINKKSIKIEVKAGSLSPSSARLKDGSLPNTGSINEAWLDSTAGKEVSGASLRIEGDDWLTTNWPESRANKDIVKLWNDADFRSTKLKNLSQFLDLLDRSKGKGASAKLITYMMSRMFPATTKVPSYNFGKAIMRMVAAIHTGDLHTIAKEQGIMAMLEYIVGKGNDGFVFFNSSTQEYKMVMGVDGVLKLANGSANPELSDVRFTKTMTMKRGEAKCSPGVYFGPLATSKRAKDYFAMYNSNPERVDLRAKAVAAGDPEFDDTATVEAPTPRTRRSDAVSTPRQKRR
jgi:hypothetical protein